MLLLPVWAPAQVDIALEFAVHVPLMEVSLSGRRATFILDTGAGMSVIDSLLAQQLGLEGKRSIALSGAGQQAEARIADNVRISWPGSERRGSFAIVPLTALSRQTGKTIGGILGCDLLSPFTVELDYDEQRARFHPAGARFDGAWTQVAKLRMEGGRPAAPAELVVGRGPAVSGHFVLDTGSNHGVTLLPGFAAREGLPREGQRTLDDPALGIAGPSPAVLTQATLFRLGNFAIAHPYVRIRQTGSKSGEGLIGGEILRRFRLAIDFPKRVLYVSPGRQFESPGSVDLGGIRLKWEGETGRGVRVESVLAERAGARAGLQAGDVIEMLDGVRGPDLDPGRVASWFRESGKVLPLTIRRGDSRIEMQLRLDPLVLTKQGTGR